MLKSNGVVSLTREQAVMRAVAASYDKQRYYGLGRGGRYPNSSEPYDAKNRVDCSGFVCHALGFDRFQQHTRQILGSWEQIDFWWSTDSLYDEARFGHNYDWFEKVSPMSKVLPGDVLVYPDYKVNGETRQGHTGIVTKVLPGFVRGAEDWYKYVMVAHATPSHRKKYGNVVALTDASAWRARELADGSKIGGTFIRYTKFKSGAVETAKASTTLTPAKQTESDVGRSDNDNLISLILRLPNVAPKRTREISN